MAQDPRQKTWQLVQTDVNCAFEYARNIHDNWYRTQSLASVALHTENKAKFRKIVNLALDSAQKTAEPNRIVSCSAWVVNTMARRDDINVLPVIEHLLQTIENEPNPVRQADALFLLFGAVYPKVELREIVLTPLLNACLNMHSWKQPKILTDIALVVAVDDIRTVNRILELISDETVRRKVIAEIEKNKWLGPHEFFPYYAKRGPRGIHAVEG